MPDTRKVIRAFLASPGDLVEERKAVRDVVLEFNESWADELGYQVELVGWEETVAGFGRPQHLINQDLDRCDLFLGMISKRWGTPPSIEGGFSSGFQEEFERSLARREQSGSPEISLFFKEIPNEFMVDPGDDLKRVLEFRKEIIAQKKILFQNFSTVRDMEGLARKCVAAYVNRVKKEEDIFEPDEGMAKRSQLEAGRAVGEKRSPESSPFSAEGFEFLEGLVARIAQDQEIDSLSAADIARFRLLANSISKPGNEQMHLGVHDINILFLSRTENTKLGKREIESLVRLGFQHLSNENVPFWCWYSSVAGYRRDVAVISSFVGANDNEKIGAISVLDSMARSLPTDDEQLKRAWIINAWLSEDSSARVRTAALGYLAKNGIRDDFAFAKKEYDRNDYSTSRNALECMIGILLKNSGGNEAQKLVLDTQFDSLDAELLHTVLNGFEHLEVSELLLGLEHRNAQVRLRSLMVLHGRRSLGIGMAERLTQDSDALVRNEAIEVLSDLGKLLSDEEVNGILIPPPKRLSFGLFGAGISEGSDKKGEELFARYQSKALMNLSEAELTKRVEVCSIYDDTTYFLLVERYFSNHAEELRHNIDDKFGAYFEERVQRMNALYGDSSTSKDVIKQTRGLEDFLRKKFTRKGLDILCRARQRKDLQRVRNNLGSGYVGASRFDADYIGKHGEWIDIPLLANAEGLSLGETLITMTGYEEFHAEVAKAVVAIGRRYSISKLVSLEMPAVILKKTIELCAESRFSKISHDALLGLFEHESEEVRKAASIMAVRSFSMKRIRSILDEYVSRDKHIYYNVIHWLDLGASMPRDAARKVARSATG